jgi:hypothetical protein
MFRAMVDADSDDIGGTREAGAVVAERRPDP